MLPLRYNFGDKILKLMKWYVGYGQEKEDDISETSPETLEFYFQ